MYRSVIILLVIASAFFAYAIPWPVGVSTAGQDSSWTIMASYGSFHDSWELCTNPNEHVNFHFGIDIPDYSLFSGPQGPQTPGYTYGLNSGVMKEGRFYHIPRERLFPGVDELRGRREGHRGPGSRHGETEGGPVSEEFRRVPVFTTVSGLGCRVPPCSRRLLKTRICKEVHHGGMQKVFLR